MDFVYNGKDSKKEAKIYTMHISMYILVKQMIHMNKSTHCSSFSYQKNYYH